MFFGFVLVNAIDSVLSFIINAYLYLGLWKEFSADFLKYSIPVLSFLLFTITTILVIKYVNQRASNFELNKIRFPKVEYIIAVIIAIFLNPLGNKLLGLMSEKLGTTTNYEISEFLDLYGTSHASIGICRWVSIIVLSIYFYRIYKKNEVETEQ